MTPRQHAHDAFWWACYLYDHQALSLENFPTAPKPPIGEKPTLAELQKIACEHPSWALCFLMHIVDADIDYCKQHINSLDWEIYLENQMKNSLK